MDRKPTQGTGCEMVDNKITLFWKQQKCRLTVPLGKANNVATFMLADGFKKSFAAFYAKVEVDYGKEQVKPIWCLPAQMVSNDEQSDNTSRGR
jgi:hypothetical protein